MGRCDSPTAQRPHVRDDLREDGSGARHTAGSRDATLTRLRPSSDGRRAVNPMIWVAAGLGVFGLANFVFLGFVGRDLGDAGSAPVAVAWTVLNAAGIGLFQPLEQETSRRLAAARARGLASAHLQRMVTFAVRTSAAIVVLGLVGVYWISDLLFSGVKELVLVAVLGLLGQALAYFARGALAGTAQFTRYGTQLGLDGALRIVIAGLLFATGSGTALTYGLVLVIAPVAATLATIKFATLRDVWRSRSGEDTSTSMVPLVASSTASQLLANFGPLAMAALATASQQGLSGRFVAAVTVARIPLFLFAAIQAVFLPALAAHVANDDAAEFGRSVRRALAITTTIGVLGIAGIAVLGHWIMSVIYGDEFGVTSQVLDLIAVSAAVFMLAQVCAQALLAHHMEKVCAVAWTVGIVVSVLTLLGPWELAVRVALALCTGAAAALLVLGAVLLRTQRAWRGTLPTGTPLAAPQLNSREAQA